MRGTELVLSLRTFYKGTSDEGGGVRTKAANLLQERGKNHSRGIRKFVCATEQICIGGGGVFEKHGGRGLETS